MSDSGDLRQPAHGYYLDEFYSSMGIAGKYYRLGGLGLRYSSLDATNSAMFDLTLDDAGSHAPRMTVSPEPQLSALVEDSSLG